MTSSPSFLYPQYAVHAPLILLSASSRPTHPAAPFSAPYASAASPFLSTTRATSSIADSCSSESDEGFGCAEGVRRRRARCEGCESEWASVKRRRRVESCEVV